MLNRILSMLLLGVMMMSFVSTAEAQAPEQEIRQMLEERDRQIKATLGDRSDFTDAQREELKRLINSSIDFEAMGRFALGEHWTDISAAEQREYVDVFADVVRAQSLSNVDIYRSSVRYNDISVDGNTARVSTTTTYRNTPAQVDYTLHRLNGAWMMTDIIIDGTSTAQGYATSFQRVFKRNGFDRLMNSLRNRAGR